MLKILLFCCLFCCPVFVEAQLQVGSSELGALNRAGKISDEEFADFKATTTVFVLQEADYKNEAAFETAIRRVWTVTPFKIIHREEINQYATKKNYSVVDFDAVIVTTGNERSSTTHTQFSYNLWMGERKKNGDIRKNLFARILLFPDVETVGRIPRQYPFASTGQMNTLLNYVHNSTKFANWGPGLLMGYLAHLNRLIAANETQGIYTEIHEDSALTKLKTDTLFIPDYVNSHIGLFVSPEKVDDDEAANDMASSYSYPIKIVPVEQLNRMIMESSKPFHYLVFDIASASKFVSVYETGKMELIYSKYTPMSYNFKNKDLRALAKFIE